MDLHWLVYFNKTKAKENYVAYEMLEISLHQHISFKNNAYFRKLDDFKRKINKIVQVNIYF